MASFLKNITLISHSATLFRDGKLKSYGLTGYQAKYILAVCKDEGISQDGLAKNLFVNKSNVTRQMSALEELGFVERRQSEEDKRVVRLYPTARAKELMPVIQSVNAEWRAVVCRGLSESEKQELAVLVEKLVVNAQEYMERSDEKNS